MNVAGKLRPKHTAGAKVDDSSPGHFLLSIPGGPAGVYRLAQVDDYALSGRSHLNWHSPCGMKIRARTSRNDLPGTWGFGYWNDPFTASLGLEGMSRRLPALPNAAWFFHASPPNYLSLRDDLPAQGFLSAAFSSPLIPSMLLVPGLLAAPLLAWPPSARVLRHLARRLVREDACLVKTNPAEWHTYQLEIMEHATRFKLDEQMIFETPTAPLGRLGMVLWIDNQYAAFDPAGRLKYGALENPPAWLEIDWVA
jgi:hypothetical protein